jgi:hypothetical protein
MTAHNTPAELHIAPFQVLDPGTGVAIRVDRWNQVIPLTIAASASETNTLAAPTGAGQKLTLFAASVGSGGSRVVTVASAIDAAGTTTLTFAAVDDRVTLESVPVTATTYEWRVTSNEGTGGPDEVLDALAVTTTDGLTVGGVIVPVEQALSFAIQPLATITEADLFIAPFAMQVTGISVVPSTLEGGACTATICKAVGTDTPVKTTTPMHTADAINLNANAYTVQSPTLTATAADLVLAAGNRISYDLSATADTAHWAVTIKYKRV